VPKIKLIWSMSSKIAPMTPHIPREDRRGPHAATMIEVRAGCAIFGAAMGIYGFAATVNAWRTRGRYFSWLALLMIIGLAAGGL